MFFLKEDEGLQLWCRHCGLKETLKPTSAEDALILETTFATTKAKQTTSAINEYTKLDPTLPRLKTISCPNQACPSQSSPETRDILYVKTEAKNLKYQYCCTVCNTEWAS
jgi:hypothetical protein